MQSLTRLSVFLMLDLVFARLIGPHPLHLILIYLISKSQGRPFVFSRIYTRTFVKAGRSSTHFIPPSLSLINSLSQTLTPSSLLIHVVLAIAF